MFKIVCLVSMVWSGSAFGSFVVQSRQEIFDHFQASGFSGVVGVASPGASFERAFGREGARQIRSSDHLLIGSVTKQFTAVAILKLVDRRLLRLDDSVTRYIPAFRFPEVTLHHLLAQTSGVSEVTGTPEFEKLKMQKFVTLDPLVALIASAPLDFHPGNRWAYSNSNYLLLSRVLEVVAGESWWSFVKRELIDPAGLRETDFLPERGARLISGNDFDKDYRLVGIESAAYLERGWANGAGGIESTVGDLIRWNSALYGGRLLTTESLRLMTSAQGKVSSSVSYGYGLFIGSDPVTGETFFYHSGGIPGFTAYNSYYPDRRLSIAALGNYEAAEPIDFAVALARFEISGRASLDCYLDDPEVPSFPLNVYEGEFVTDAAPLGFSLTFEGGKLYSSFNGQPRHRLVIRGRGHFHDRSLGLDLRFKEPRPDEFEVAAGSTRYLFKRRGPPSASSGGLQPFLQDPQIGRSRVPVTFNIDVI